MRGLSEIYGYCIIPRDTLLFRGKIDTSFGDSTFFATKLWVAGAFNDTIQVWKTNTDIKILFLVEDINSRSWTNSALPNLYNTIFPRMDNSNFDSLEIKHISRRNKLVRKLVDEYKVSGWLSSLENKVELEVCLFDKEANENQLQLIDTVDRKNKTYFKDSLTDIKIYPSRDFYERTKQKLTEQHKSLTSDSALYKNYKKMIEAEIKQQVQNGMSEVVEKHNLFDLRTKLKI